MKLCNFYQLHIAHRRNILCLHMDLENKKNRWNFVERKPSSYKSQQLVYEEKSLITTGELTAFSIMEYSNISFCCTRFLSQFTFIDVCSSITTTNSFRCRWTFWTLT